MVVLGVAAAMLSAVLFFGSPNQRAKYGSEVWLMVDHVILKAGMTRREAFVMFDTDGSGELSGEELVDGLRNSGIILSDAYAEGASVASNKKAPLLLLCRVRSPFSSPQSSSPIPTWTATATSTSANGSVPSRTR